MNSYPNLIPLGRAALRQVEAQLAPLAYDRIYGAWPRAPRPGRAHQAGRRLARSNDTGRRFR